MSDVLHKCRPVQHGIYCNENSVFICNVVRELFTFSLKIYRYAYFPEKINIQNVKY